MAKRNNTRAKEPECRDRREQNGRFGPVSGCQLVGASNAAEVQKMMGAKCPSDVETFAQLMAGELTLDGGVASALDDQDPYELSLVLCG